MPGERVLPYQVDIPDAEQAFLDGLPLSIEAKARINQFVEHTVGNIPDGFRLDPANRLTPDSPYFLIRHVILDRWGDGGMHTLDFHIQDDGARFGVLLIVFIDHQ
jgi:hypothetical protein